ncbi:MAG: polyribonucleotide nucleotidyltransferase [Candidatus Firestonebacteria bacterium]
MNIEEKVNIGGREIIISTGKVAKLAEGSCLVRYGDTVVLSSVSSSEAKAEKINALPLTVEYKERTYSAGKIPGGFFKREGRPKEREILSARMIDRSIRPLFSPDLMNEIQVINFVLSYDLQNEADVLGLIGTSAALSITNIPFNGPIGSVRVGKIKDRYIINPTFSELEESVLDIVVVYSKLGVVMLEAGTKEVKEEEILAAINLAKEPSYELIRIQEELSKKVQKPEKKYTFFNLDENLKNILKETASQRLSEVETIQDKKQRLVQIQEIKEEILQKVLPDFKDKEMEIKIQLDLMEAQNVRENIVERGIRPDGRKLDEIREIKCEIGVLPRTHGSALFSRGQTQALVITTLGTEDDAQILDDLEGESKKRYMLHYNFPPLATGDVKPVRGPGRREIGHGALAEKALLAVIPPKEKFPYVVNIVSDILESNGSSSMATVCGGSLSLMDAGVPITKPVAGISIGLIKEKDKFVTLTDIAGAEDHFGDMDFKIAGTEDGITAIQMDVKVDGVSIDILEKSLFQAKEARRIILNEMNKAIIKPRDSISLYAPKIISLKINPDKIKDVIGQGGKTIKKIVEETGVEINIEADGVINISGVNNELVQKAIAIIKNLTQEAEVGKIYSGKVRKITDFGAFVEILPGQDGLVHISEIADKRINRVEDVLKEGEEVLVKVIEIDKLGRLKLSRKEALKSSQETENKS